MVLDDGGYKYVYGLGLAYAVDSLGNTLTQHTDGLGSVRAETDSSGNVVQTYGTDEFGIVDAALTSGTQPTPFQYTGEPRDSETGLVYLRARSYDPSVGRFMQADPLRKSGPGVVGWNRYSYVGNNPTIASDPSGTCSSQICSPPAGTSGQAAAGIVRNVRLPSLDPCSTFRFICINLDTSTIIASIAEPAVITPDIQAIRSELILEFLTHPIVVATATALSEAQQFVSRNAGPLEQANFAGLLQRIYSIPDAPSERVLSLPGQEALDKIIFGTADKLGITTYTSDAAFVANAYSNGVLLDVYIHRPIRLATR